MKKIYIRYKLLEMVSVVVGMLLAACSDSHYSDLSEADDEYVDVTFTLTPETALSTRADDDNSSIIGQGKMIDMLIYAVYLENKDGSLTHLTQYGKDGIVDAEDDIVYQYEDFDFGEGEKQIPAIPDKEAFQTHKGQTIVYFRERFTSYSISLRLMRTAKYRLAFWAQSSQTDAYDTSNLREVKVHYSTTEENDETKLYPNNDESRDAFCKVDAFSMETSASENARSVQLTRPFAQINVGTTEEDYNSHSEYGCSQIKLVGVADQIDVAEDIVSSSEDVPEEVTFAWAEIPQIQYKESLSAVYPNETEGNATTSKNKTSNTCQCAMCWCRRRT